MVLLGVLMILLGAALVLAGLFATEVNTRSDELHMLGIEVSPPTLFIFGVVATALVLLGIWVIKTGAKRGWRHRQEQRKYEELGERLARANRDRDLDEE